MIITNLQEYNFFKLVRHLSLVDGTKTESFPGMAKSPHKVLLQLDDELMNQCMIQRESRYVEREARRMTNVYVAA